MVFLPCAHSFNVLYTYCLFKLCLTFLSSSDALSVTSPESKASQSLPAAPGLALAWCLFTIWAFLYFTSLLSLISFPEFHAFPVLVYTLVLMKDCFQ